MVLRRVLQILLLTFAVLGVMLASVAAAPCCTVCAVSDATAGVEVDGCASDLSTCASVCIAAPVNGALRDGGDAFPGPVSSSRYLVAPDIFSRTVSPKPDPAPPRFASLS